MSSEKKNLSPNVWGPCAWIFLHSISYSYPENPTENHKKEYLDFLNSLTHVIPCENCRQHFSEYIIENPPKLNSRDEFSEWLIDLHNNVNMDNKKNILTYEDVHKKYMELYEDEKKLNPLSDNDFEEIKMCLALLLMVTLSYCIWKVVK